jgi:hypothetical protein
MLRPLSTHIIVDDLEVQAAKVNALTHRALKVALGCSLFFFTLYSTFLSPIGTLR